VVGRSVDRQRLTDAANTHAPHRPHLVDQLAFPSRLHIFRRITSCSISLSSDRFATSFFSRWLLDPGLAADLGNRRPFLGLPQHKRNLLLAEP
jgi:hypothetical protein